MTISSESDNQFCFSSCAVAVLDARLAAREKRLLPRRNQLANTQPTDPDEHRERCGVRVQRYENRPAAENEVKIGGTRVKENETNSISSSQAQTQMIERTNERTNKANARERV